MLMNGMTIDETGSNAKDPTFLIELEQLSSCWGSSVQLLARENSQKVVLKACQLLDLQGKLPLKCS